MVMSTWLDSIQMSGGIRKKLQMTPYTILINSCFAKVAVKSNCGLADVKVLPHIVVSLAGLHADVRGVRKKLQMTSYTILINSYLAKDAVKSTSGLADVEVLTLGGASLAQLHPDGCQGGHEKVANNFLRYHPQFLFSKRCCKVNFWACRCSGSPPWCS